MVQVPSLAALLGLTLCILPLHNTMAQQFGESDVVYEAARNKIGLIRYCRNIGLLDPAIAELLGHRIMQRKNAERQAEQGGE